MCQSCRLGAITEAVESYGNSQKNTYTYTYDVCGQPLNYMGATCEWDVYGNLVSYSKGNDKITYTYTSDGRRRSKTVNGVTTTYRYHNGLLLSETTGDETLRYYYDNTGAVLSIGYIKGSKAENKYFFTRNAQNDIVSVYRSSDSKLIGTYEYDLWGKPISIKEATQGIDTDGILIKNPLRYRGYRYDAETEFYHLKSRYYDPNIRRFISADTVEAVKVEVISTNGNNLFAYCENSPVCFEDSNGQYVETPYDFVTLEMSLMEAAAPEGGFWEWVNVALDFADIAIPYATFPIGTGEICRFIRYACKSPAGELATEAIGYADEAGDVAKVTLKRIDNLPRKPKGRHKNSFSKFRTSKGANTVTFPQGEAQLKHIFRNADGHVPDTPANRQMILDVTNNMDNYLGKDARGNDWYAFISEDGTQTWVRVRNGIIDNAGVNTVPRIWDSETGLYNNINN